MQLDRTAVTLPNSTIQLDESAGKVEERASAVAAFSAQNPANMQPVELARVACSLVIVVGCDWNGDRGSSSRANQPWVAQ